MLLLGNKEKFFMLTSFDILKFSKRDDAHKFIWSWWNSSDRWM